VALKKHGNGFAKIIDSLINGVITIDTVIFNIVPLSTGGDVDIIPLKV
jgi:hypothetical protein